MKKKIALTGATGYMGMAGLKELVKRLDRFDVTVLARNSKKNHEKLQPFQDLVRIVWGDLTHYDDVARFVEGADYVLHVGGLVSPKTDYFPKKTLYCNIIAAKNIAKAVMAQPNANDIKVCYIGSVSQTSDRSEPIHWGRTGDPIAISVYDHYAISKTIAERILVESGIKNWVCLRQSGILYPEILKNYDPIMFHVPLRGVLEWATIEDSGRVLANLCEQEVPQSFWNHFYNIGSGKEYRLTNYEFEVKLLKTISCPPPEKIFEPQWFVLRNFHGQWYQDSDKLEEFLHFRANIPVDEYFKQMGKAVPGYFRLAKLCPPVFIKMAMKSLANKAMWGTQWWIKNNDKARIAAYYGSMEKYLAIKPWAEQDFTPPSKDSEGSIRFDHGYDERVPRDKWNIEDMKKVAAFRGGECLSSTMEEGDYQTPLKWRCAHGHEFMASPVLILEGGHWCDKCLPCTEEESLQKEHYPKFLWNYDEQARVNPFFAQVWTPIHGDNEDNCYTEKIFEGWD